MSSGKSMINTTNVLLLKISKRLTTQELRDMKYLCSDHIAEGTLEKITTVIDLFKQIPQLIDIEDYGKSFISELLKSIGRVDLSNELLGISDDEKKPQQQSQEMKYFLQVEKMVAADWKRLGRHLGLEHYILEEIDADRKNAREKCACVLDKWKKLHGADIYILKQRLLEMGRKDVVNELEQTGGANYEKDTVTPTHPSEESESKSTGHSQNPAGNDDYRSYTQDKYTVQSSTKMVHSRDKLAGNSVSGKYNINVHPGSHVMVGDCGTMTIYAHANIDHKTVQVVNKKTGDVQSKGGTEAEDKSSP